MRGCNFSISDFYCTKCGNKGVPIPRRDSRVREKGHLKRLYCIYCKDVVNHVEIRAFDNYTYEDFKQDFEEGKFKEDIINEEI